jgi:hypothetical protein
VDTHCLNFLSKIVAESGSAVAGLILLLEPASTVEHDNLPAKEKASARNLLPAVGVSDVSLALA